MTRLQIYSNPSLDFNSYSPPLIAFNRNGTANCAIAFTDLNGFFPVIITFDATNLAAGLASLEWFSYVLITASIAPISFYQLEFHATLGPIFAGTGGHFMYDYAGFLADVDVSNGLGLVVSYAAANLAITSFAI
jgi:hypothetical protein